MAAPGIQRLGIARAGLAGAKEIRLKVFFWPFSCVENGNNVIALLA
jgi:hypothetical protein